MEKLKAGILGARGEVGRRFIDNLVNHPYFKLSSLYGSERTEGMNYGEASGRSDLPESVLKMKLKYIQEDKEIDVNDDLFFSALPSKTAQKIEGKLAEEKPVFSTASAYRMEKDTPIFVPGINESHMDIIKVQQENRGWKGFVIPQSNCTVLGLATSLYPIYKKGFEDDRFKITDVYMVSEQAVSGASYEAVMRWKRQREEQGVELPRSLSYKRKVVEYNATMFEGNVDTWIPQEMEKVRGEALKIMGSYDPKEKQIVEPSFYLDCLCSRVPILDGHMEGVFLVLEGSPAVDELKEVWRNYRGEPQIQDLPSAPKEPIIVIDEPDRPQSRYDITREDGMAAVIGMVRKSSLNRYKYFVLSHNTKMGAAKGVVLAAEYMYQIGKLA
jgi:aspartate-semialdehyde dehydrogenase